MFRAKFFEKCYFNLNIVRRTYLSNQSKTVWSQHVTVPKLDFKKMQVICNRNAVDFYLISGPITSEKKEDDVFDLCMKQRSIKTTPNSRMLTNYVVVNQLVTSNKTEVLLRLLSNRPSYGVFLNDCSASLVMNHLLEIQDYSAAVKIINNIYLDKIDNELVSALSVYAYFKYVEQKAHHKDIKSEVPDIKNEADNMDKTELTAKPILNLASKFSTDIQLNLKALTFLLCKQHNELHNLINVNSTEISEDVLKICQASMKDTNAEAGLVELINNKIVSNQNLLQFEKKLKSLIEESLKRQEPLLIEKQFNICTQWLKEIEENLSADLVHYNDLQTAAELKNTIAEMKSNQQKFWFFNEEEDIYLKIHNKKVEPVKKWLGKRKKPRVADKNYVPPEIKQKDVV